MAADTREQFLDSAESLFADRGFYGVSIAAIADQLGLTKQALLHHFGSKEKLYGEVLKRISDRFSAIESDMRHKSLSPTERLGAYMLRLHRASNEYPDQNRLLMRELLDNQRRADAVSTWYLKPFLERLIESVRAIPNWSDASEAEALAVGYQLLGMINYFAVSQPTLSGIFGDEAYGALETAFERQLRRSVVAVLSSRDRPR